MGVRPSGRRRLVGWTIWALSAALAVAWLIEAHSVGRGFVSTYLAPFAIVGNLFGAFLAGAFSRGASSDPEQERAEHHVDETR